MTDVPLKNQIIEWLRKQYYWFQHAGNHLLEGNDVDEGLIQIAYQFFREDLELCDIAGERTPVEFIEVLTAEVGVTSQLALRSISGVENVNALMHGQEIKIDKNLTLIYGNNGAGKSGYIRLLNNAFNSRGDKKILQNVFDVTANGQAKGKFLFQSTGEPYFKEFPDEKSCLEFSLYNVFDTQSVKVHLDGNNQLNFTPRGFEFFDKILNLLEALERRLNAEIRANRPSNAFIVHFMNETPIKSLITSLGAHTNDEELEKAGVFGEEEANQLESIKSKIAKLKELNVQVQIAAFEKLQRELGEFIHRQEEILKRLTKDKVDYYLGLIDTFKKLELASKEEGIKSLENYQIDLIGSPNWREFIVAARNYSSAIVDSRQALAYPSEGDHCVFCLQPLSQTETVLIETYWQLLRSEAERELNRIEQKIKLEIKEMKGLSPVIFNDSTNLYVYLNSLYPELVAKWLGIVQASETQRQNIIRNLDSLNKDIEITCFSDNLNEFVSITTQIAQEIAALFARKPDQEIATLTFQMNVLIDRSLLNKLLPEIRKFVLAHKWALSAEQCFSALKTNSITTFQGGLYTKHVNDEYNRIFAQECTKLKAPKGIEIIQQNAKAKTYRKLTVGQQAVSDVLSEGEQRAISLADFLTEVQLNPMNRGVIFDDPVTSLDHERRELIAKRLVEIAKDRQVVIFTHDISFFVKLTSIADKSDNLTVTKTTVRRIGNDVGIIRPDLPWIAQKLKERIAYLRNALVKLKTLEKEGREDDYNIQIKGWYGLLREAWERSIEERLFKGAIERFSGEIHTKPLQKVEVTSELVGMIDEGMTQSSNWVHDQAMGLNPPIPDTTKAESDLNYLNEFSEKCKV